MLLRTTKRASVFRLVNVDLKNVTPSPSVFRQLFFSFLFDLVELWTLSSWILYPIFVAVFWTLESTCVETELVISVSSISPLIGCMYSARYHLMGVAIGWCGLCTAASLMYFLRYLDERRKLFSIDSNPRWWHLSPFLLVMLLLFVAGLASCAVSLAMLGKPLLSNQPEAKKIYMAVPGVVLFCGSLLLVFHVGRKLAASWHYSRNPNISIFFERGCALSGRLTDATELEQLEELDEVGTPYMRALNEDILY